MLDEGSVTIASTQKNKNRRPYTNTSDIKAIISKNTTRSSSSRAATAKTYILDKEKGWIRTLNTTLPTGLNSKWSLIKVNTHHREDARGNPNPNVTRPKRDESHSLRVTSHMTLSVMSHMTRRTHRN